LPKIFAPILLNAHLVKKDQTTPSFRNLIVEYFQVVVRMDLIVPEMDLNGDLLINALMPLIARVHRQVEALSRY
jgi:hypothetical protein